MKKPSIRAPILIILISIAILLVSLLVTLATHSPRFGSKELRRITIGMTRAKVESIIGCPPGNYRHKRLGDDFVDGDPSYEFVAGMPAERAFALEREKEHAIVV